MCAGSLQAHVRGQHARPHHQRPEDGGGEQPGVPAGRGGQAGEEPAGRPSCSSARGEPGSALPGIAAWTCVGAAQVSCGGSHGKNGGIQTTVGSSVRVTF